MNDAHFHLVINHFPIIIPFIGFILILLGVVLKSELLKRVAFFILVLGSVSTVLAYVSGEGAEEIVEHLPGADEHFIHEHEEVAEQFSMLMHGLGLLSLVGIWANWKQKSFATILTYAALFFSGVMIVYGIQVGNSGGEIMHKEIRKDFKMPTHHDHHEEEGHHYEDAD